MTPKEALDWLIGAPIEARRRVGFRQDYLIWCGLEVGEAALRAVDDEARGVAMPQMQGENWHV